MPCHFLFCQLAGSLEFQSMFMYCWLFVTIKNVIKWYTKSIELRILSWISYCKLKIIRYCLCEVGHWWEAICSKKTDPPPTQTYQIKLNRKLRQQIHLRSFWHHSNPEMFTRNITTFTRRSVASSRYWSECCRSCSVSSIYHSVFISTVSPYLDLESDADS